MGEFDVTINIVEGDTAPRYDGRIVEAKLQHVTITEKATMTDLPLVDIVAAMPNGDRVLIVCSGRIVNMISAAIKGVNMRNHRIEEP